MAYDDWGFSSSPFQTSALPASALGERLLVGRQVEVKALTKRIKSYPKMATIEGLNGVGKTSIVNVASYQLFQQHVRTKMGPLFIPCRRIFQIDPTKDVQEFIDAVLMDVAQTLIDKAKEITEINAVVDTGQVNRWLNAPQLNSFQAGGWGFQGGVTSETNTGQGFERSGFRKAITTWLEYIFPDADSGGVICTIDNLELLQSSETARGLLEKLRDELFNIHGIRWVLCGSLGIIYGVVSSPRLEGYMHTPIAVGEIDESHAPDLLTSRMQAYSTSGQEPYLPLTKENFDTLYKLLRGNLRSVLSYTDDYCQHVQDGEAPDTDEDKDQAFMTWLNNRAAESYEANKADLRPRAMQVFDKACEKVLFAPSDHNEFGLNSIAAFRPHISDLEDAGLLVSTQDEGDKRRKTIQVTPKGWLLQRHIQTLAASSTPDNV